MARLIPAPPGHDLDRYIDSLLARFANPSLNQRLIQIAMDGSQRIPQRWLEALAVNQRAGRPSPAMLTALGAWIGHVRGDNVTRWGPVQDPRAAAVIAVCGTVSASTAAKALFGVNGVLQSDWAPAPDDIAFLDEAESAA